MTECSQNSRSCRINKPSKDLKRLSYSRNTGQDMEKALQYVRNGISIREAAKVTNLAYATVRRYWLKSIDTNNLKSKTISNTTNSKHVFNEEQEYQLIKYCAGIPDSQCKKLAYRIAMLNKITVDPNWHDNQMASDDWLNDFKLRHSITNDCSNNLLNNSKPPYNKQINLGTSNKRESAIRRSLPLLTPISKTILDEEIQQIKCEVDISEYDEEFNDSDFESTSDEGDGIPTEKLNNIFTVIHTPNAKLSELEDKRPNLENNIDKNPDKEKEIPNTQESNLIEEDTTLKINSLFQSELINTLKIIANTASSQKDPDEQFLLSLLPTLKKIKESEKLKARIELMKVLEKFN